MKKVLIWGTGKVAERCLNILNSSTQIMAFVQSDVERESFFKGIKIISGDNISTIDYDYIILANTHEREIITQFHLDKHVIVSFRAVMDGMEEDEYNLFDIRNDGRIYLSYGENCLTERLLERIE